MGIKDFFNKFKRNDTITLTNKYAYDLTSTVVQTGYLDYAISLCVSKIANALSQCEIETYKDGIRYSDHYYYKFNVEPNRNMNTTQFWHAIVQRMITSRDGALIIQSKEGDLILVDDWNVKERAFYPNVYSDLKIGDLILDKKFLENEVLRLKFDNDCMSMIISKVYNEFASLLQSSMTTYKRKNTRKIVVNIQSMFQQFREEVTQDGKSTKYDDLMDSLFKDRLKGLFTDRDSAIPLEEGLDFTDVSENQGNSATQELTKDIRGLFDDILNIVADALNVPRALLKGDVADIEAVTDNFITFCVTSYASMLEDEINRKLYKKDEFLRGTKVRVRTATIKSYDMTKLASSMEALFRIGVFCPNDVRRLIREEPILESWANEYSITKNYESTKNQHLKGDNTN